MQNLIEKIRNEFPQKRIVIVGDLVADQFLRGTINRVSREAPVFILRHDETETLAGGAGNAAVNAASLGGKITAVGVIGKDENGKALLGKLKQSNINCENVITTGEIQTNTKVRVLAGQHYAPRQQVIRIDYESKIGENSALVKQLKENIKKAAKTADAIIFSDYDYGTASEETFKLCTKIAEKKQIPLLIDSRFRLDKFTNATTATPNQEEVEQILGENFTAADCVSLREKLKVQALLVTRGNRGMLLIEKAKKPLEIEVVGSKEPIDVTGAGDTVIAAYALGLASGLGFADAAKLANFAGGIVVMKKGTATVSAVELTESIENNS